MTALTDFELQIFTKVKELERLKKEEIQKSVSTFVQNPIILQYSKEIAEAQQLCTHSVIENDKCQICGKRMEGNE